MNPLIGCQCHFWIHYSGKRHKRTGVIVGVRYNGMLKIQTGYGIEAYYHYRSKASVEIVQPKMKEMYQPK